MFFLSFLPIFLAVAALCFSPYQGIRVLLEFIRIENLEIGFLLLSFDYTGLIGSITFLNISDLY